MHTLMTTLAEPKREYTYFVYDTWGASTTWASRLINGCVLEPQAQNYFWQTYQEKILNELQPWLDHGYQVEDEIGGSAIKVYLEKKVHLPLDIIDVLIWIMTFGVAFLMEQQSGQKRVFAVYRPIEFRLRLYCPPEPQLSAIQMENAVFN
jgi:hypothetical protein